MWCLWCGKRRVLQKQRSKPMMRSIRYSIDKTKEKILASKFKDDTQLEWILETNKWW